MCVKMKNDEKNKDFALNVQCNIMFANVRPLPAIGMALNFESVQRSVKAESIFEMAFDSLHLFFTSTNLTINQLYNSYGLDYTFKCDLFTILLSLRRTGNF